MSFKKSLKNTGKKLKVIVADPGFAARTVGQTVAKVASGEKVVPGSVAIPMSVQKKDPTIGSVIGAPVALLAGAGAGTLGGIGGSLLPAGSLRDTVVNHPFVSAGAVGAAVLAPAAVVIGANQLLPDKDGSSTKETVIVQQAPPAPVVPPSPQVVEPPKKPKRKKAKKKPTKRRTKKKSKRRKKAKKKSAKKRKKAKGKRKRSR